MNDIDIINWNKVYLDARVSVAATGLPALCLRLGTYDSVAFELERLHGPTWCSRLTDQGFERGARVIVAQREHVYVVFDMDLPADADMVKGDPRG